MTNAKYAPIGSVEIRTIEECSELIHAISMKVYVACPVFYQPKAKELAGYLKSEGHTITSRWFDHPPLPEAPDAETRFAQNMEDVDRAEILVVTTYSDHGRETYVEVGRALCQSKYVVWLQGNGGECLSLLAHHRVLKAKTPAEVKRILANHGR